MSNHPRFEHPATEKLNEALAEIEQGERHLHEAINNLPSLIGDNSELKQAIISHIYWYEERIKATWIGDVFGLEGRSICKIANSATITMSCQTCGERFETTVNSRAQLNEIRNGYGIYGYRNLLCKTCTEKDEQKKAEESAKFSKEYDAQKAAQKAHLEELHTMPYYEYLQTPEWQDRRKKSMRRAGFRCAVCNAYGVRLNVHHKTYERRGYEEDRDLIVLCQDCHQIFHDNGSLADWEE